MGIVKFFNATKGFGFISPEGGGSDLFVHATAAELAGMPVLVEGQRITFDIQTDSKGAKAVNLSSIPFDEASPLTSTENQSSSGTVAIIIYHNPDCEISRKVLAAIRLTGIEPRIVEYLSAPPSVDEMKRLALLANIRVRDLVRKIEPLYQELRLDAADASDADILDAMTKHPVLINRPIVATENIARLCRPSTAIKSFLSEVTLLGASS